ncbi:Cof-type HAD-IIB family hydrolase [Candidatus Poribacteria bacterium]|nr:Cof-type HAD-IIB family hydrolase [Candidatus Poribacteria bacterium]
MSKYKLLAIDLDKTLLDNEHKVPHRNYEILKECQKKGIYVILASGREVETIDNFSDILEIYDPIIACVGAIVCGEKIDGKRELLYHIPIPSGMVDRVMEFTRNMGWCLTVHYPDKILAMKQDKYTDIYHNQTGATFTFARDFYQIIENTQPTKLITIVKPEMREQVYQQFVQKWGNEANITRTNPEYVELNAKGVDKGKALIELCRILNIPIKQTMAFGDNYSDLPMLEVAGGKVLMDNASDEIKKDMTGRFDDLIIAPSNEDSGVAQIIEQIL